VCQRCATAWQSYQRTGTKATKCRLKKLSSKEGSLRRLVNHTISKRLVAYAKDTKAALVLGFGMPRPFELCLPLE
jgi:hypothetical protein